MKHFTALVLLTLIVGAPRAGATADPTDMAGEWAVQFAAPSGPQEFTMYIAQNGGRLSGRLTSDAGEFPLRGRIEDDSFTINWSMPDAGKVIDITFTGTVLGETLSGTAKLGKSGQGPLSGQRTSQ